MRQYIHEAARRPSARQAVRFLGAGTNRQAIEAAGRAAYKALYFEPHVTAQYLNSPERTLRAGVANCVDYSILLGTWAAVNNLRTILRLVQLPGHSDLAHVYPIIEGLPVDLVIGQNQNGVEKFTRQFGTFPQIGKELVYLRSSDFTI